LKFLIQWIAASESEQKLIYNTFNDIQLTKSFKDISEFIFENDFSISQVYQKIVGFQISDDFKKSSLFEYFKK
jgi:hypothetical protein